MSEYIFHLRSSFVFLFSPSQRLFPPFSLLLWTLPLLLRSRTPNYLPTHIIRYHHFPLFSAFFHTDLSGSQISVPFTTIFFFFFFTNSRISYPILLIPSPSFWSLFSFLFLYFSFISYIYIYTYIYTITVLSINSLAALSVSNGNFDFLPLCGLPITLFISLLLLPSLRFLYLNLFSFALVLILTETMPEKIYWIIEIIIIKKR